MDWDELVAAATGARERSYSPYSGFKVGSAILMEDGFVSPGCNVENRTFGLTVCAERVALAAAVAGGHGRPRAVAVITDTSPPAVPCGMCREALAEFADGQLPILLVNPDGERREFTLGELLPHPFVFPDRG